MDIAYRAVDADNHYYETLDAFTRHLDTEFRAARRAGRCSEGTHTLLLVGGKLNRFIPNPTFDPIIVPGCLDLLFRGQIPEGVDPRTLMQVEPLRAEYQDRDARLAVMDEQGLEAVAAVPDPRLRHRAGAARRHPRDDGEPVGVQPLARGRLGLLVPGPHHRGADALARRSRRARSRSSTGCSSAARAWCTSGPRRCPTANGRGRSLGDPLHDPVWARLAEAVVPVAFHLGDSGYERVRRRRGAAATTFGRSGSVDVLAQAPRVGPRHPRHDRVSSSSHGVFNRHPTLRVASIENGSDWVRAAGEAAAQAGQPDAVGVRRGPARHDPPARVGHAVLRGGPRASSPTSSASSASCSAPTGRTARGSPSRSTSSRSSHAFSDDEVRRIMRDNCLDLLGRRSVRVTETSRRRRRRRAARRGDGVARRALGPRPHRSTSGGASSPTRAGRRRTSRPSRAGAATPARVGHRRRAPPSQTSRRAATARRPRPAHGRADDPHATAPRSRSRGSSRRSSTARSAWCQLFSEPGAGSDLAGLTTRADARRRPLGDHRARRCGAARRWSADYGMLLARTDFDVPKHAGISWFAFPLDQPGVTIRPLREMTGDALFNEVFFDDAVVRRRRPHRRRRATAGRSRRPRCIFERTGIGAGGTMAASRRPGPKGGILGCRAGDAARARPPAPTRQGR